MRTNPTLFRILLNSIKNGWTDPDYGCSANWKWYIRFKVFGRAFKNALLNSYLRRNGICMVRGYIHIKDDESYMTSLYCNGHCDKRYEKDDSKYPDWENGVYKKRGEDRIFSKGEIDLIKNTPVSNKYSAIFIKLPNRVKK